MGVLLWQKTVLPESIITSGLSASGAALGLSAQGRPAIVVPLDAAGDVTVVVRCGRILEPLASSAPLFVMLSLFTAYTDADYTFKVQCSARRPGDDADPPSWNQAGTAQVRYFPSTPGELVHAELNNVAPGYPRDDLQPDDELDILLRLPPVGGPAESVLYLCLVEVRQELPS